MLQTLFAFMKMEQMFGFERRNKMGMEIINRILKGSDKIEDRALETENDAITIATLIASIEVLDIFQKVFTIEELRRNIDLNEESL